MKTRYSLLLFSICCATNARALIGTYTIGGASPDYLTFSAAAADLSAQGVTGAVEFIVRPGTYSEQVVIDSIPGSSSSNTVTFHSLNNDSSSVTLSYTASNSASNNYTLLIRRADNITFHHLGFARTGAMTYSTIVEVAKGADNITFLNNKFTGPVGIVTINSDGSRSCLFSTDSASNNNLVVANNSFKDNSNGIWVNGDPNQYATGFVISNNVFDNFYVGIFILYQDAPEISSNSITRNAPSSTIDYYGISVRYTTGAQLISRNKITAHSGNYGIRLRACNGTALTQGMIVNNFSQAGDATSGRGLAIEDNCTYQRVLHNNIHYTGSAATLGRALQVDGTTTGNLELLNNIFANTGGGYAMYVSSIAAPGISVSDNNCFYATGPTLAFWSANTASLANLQAASGKDVYSLSGNPVFTSVSDLHVSASFLATAGSPLAGVADDIDGQPRNLSFPDIGADQITPVGIPVLNDKNEFSVYPNPTKDKVRIETKEPGNAFEVRDISGKLLIQDFNLEPVVELDLSMFESGLYFLTFYMNDKAVHRKIVKD